MEDPSSVRTDPNKSAYEAFQLVDLWNPYRSSFCLDNYCIFEVGRRLYPIDLDDCCNLMTNNIYIYIYVCWKPWSSVLNEALNEAMDQDSRWLKDSGRRTSKLQGPTERHRGTYIFSKRGSKSQWMTEKWCHTWTMTVATIGSEYAPCMEYLPSGLVNVGIKNSSIHGAWSRWATARPTVMMESRLKGLKARLGDVGSTQQLIIFLGKPWRFSKGFQHLPSGYLT